MCRGRGVVINGKFQQEKEEKREIKERGKKQKNAEESRWMPK